MSAKFEVNAGFPPSALTQKMSGIHWGLRLHMNLPPEGDS